MARKSKVNICAVLGLAMILIGGIYVLICTFMGLYNKWIYRIVFAVWVILYMVLTDFVEPKMTRKFRHKNKKQVAAYYKYAALDMLGVLGLLWFAVMAGMLKDYTHYAGIAIFVACFVPKNAFYKIYNMRRSQYDWDDEEEVVTTQEDDFDDFDISF